jgi:hypothetical protein
MRFNVKTESPQRYLEERLPYFSIYLPDEYRKSNPRKYKNLIKNANLLTSPFDIYATIRELTCLDEKVNNKVKKSKQMRLNYERSISLLEKISLNRNCFHIGISQHYCVCEERWQNLSVEQLDVHEAVNFTISSINLLIKTAKDLCIDLKLKKILSAEKLTKRNKNIYKIEFSTYPNDGIYESLSYSGYKEGFEFTSDSFSIASRNDISRIDAYGGQPKCVANFGSNNNLMLDLRKFCYCKGLESKEKKANSDVSKALQLKILIKPRYNL